MKFKTEILTMNLADPFGVAPYTRKKKQNVLLTLGDQEAYGEASTSRYYGESLKSAVAAFEKVKDLLIEDEIFYIEPLMQRIFDRIPEDNAARAMIEMALFDYIGKKLELPLYKLLGIKPPDDKQTSFTIGIDTIDKMLQKVEAASQYPVLKIKLGRNASQDVKVMKEIRKRTDKVLRVDANGGWSLDEAIKCIKILADLGVEYVEQPLGRGRLKQLRVLKPKSPLPIFLDEDVHRCDSIPPLLGLCDGINVKLMKTGGIIEARRMIATARTFGLQLMLGCMLETSVGITAAAHIASYFDYIDLDGNLLIANDPFDGVKVEDGYLRLSGRPGLGVVRKTQYL